MEMNKCKKYLHDISCFFAIEIDQDDFLVHFRWFPKFLCKNNVQYLFDSIQIEYIHRWDFWQSKQREKWWAIAFFRLFIIYYIYGFFRKQSDKNETKAKAQTKKRTLLQFFDIIEFAIEFLLITQLKTQLKRKRQFELTV